MKSATDSECFAWRLVWELSEALAYLTDGDKVVTGSDGVPWEAECIKAWRALAERGQEEASYRPWAFGETESVAP